MSRQIQGQLLFEDVELTIEKGDRLGVIGVNGSGKSTLLQVLAGLQEPDTGTVTLAGGCRVGYLAQDAAMDEDRSVREAVYEHHREALRLWDRYQEACEKGELDKLDGLTQQLERAGFYELQTRADMAIQHLGLSDVRGPVRHLSGGQRRRVAMAQALTFQPDLLLLDEPTNHLDPDTIRWLETYLAQYRGALVVITHDRYFLDRVTSRTLEIEDARVTTYVGNYARYLEKKAEQAAIAEATRVKRANLWRRELEWLRRGPKARATKQKARIERAEELRPEAQQERAKLEILLASQRLGRKVLELQGVSKRFGDKQIVKNLDLTLESGARIGLIGPNGAGKTTLLDLMSGRLEPDEGKVERGSTVRLGYFDQESRRLDPDQKVLESLRDVAESIPLANGEVLTASQMLERFLFSGRLQHALVGRLSGGERRRLYLLQILMGNPNVLFLDEPTNDLDIPTLSCLEDYLDGFPGALVVSSHDRYFLDRTVDTLLAFEGGDQPRRFTGCYSDYVPLQPKPAAAPKPAAPRHGPAASAAEQQPRKLSFKEKRELEQLEKDIAAGEQLQAELEARLVDHASDFSVVEETYARLEQVKRSLEKNVERWAELAELA